MARNCESGFHIILVNPKIPPNTGNIARLCAATKTRLHLVHPLGFDTDEKSLRRAGLDYWKHVDVNHHQSFAESLANSGEGEVKLFSAKGNKIFTEAAYEAGDRLVFGSETDGLPPEIIEAYPSHCYRIPIWGEVRSLNLSTAVGIVAYEAFRQAGAWPVTGDTKGQPDLQNRLEEFRPLKGMKGKLFVPRPASAKKYPCDGCYSCNWCGETRCSVCRSGD